MTKEEWYERYVKEFMRAANLDRQEAQDIRAATTVFGKATQQTPLTQGGPRNWREGSHSRPMP